MVNETLLSVASMILNLIVIFGIWGILAEAVRRIFKLEWKSPFMFLLIWPTLYAAIFSWDYLLG
jgi:hypothetical protein